MAYRMSRNQKTLLAAAATVSDEMFFCFTCFAKLGNVAASNASLTRLYYADRNSVKLRIFWMLLAQYRPSLESNRDKRLIE